MRELDFLDALGRVDEKYIIEAVNSEITPRKKRTGRNCHGQTAIISAAASVAVICGTVFLLRGIDVGKANRNGFIIKDGILLAYTGSDTNVIIPDSVKEIADGAFAENENSKNIVSLKLGKSLTDLEAADLTGLSGLESLDRGNSAAFTERGGAVISNCGEVLLSGSDRTITEYTIPDGVLYIAPGAFTGFDLEKADFGGTVEYIGFNAFASTPLREINLPDSVREIAPGAFSWCFSAVSGRIPDGAKYYADSFEYVPFFVEKTTGSAPPSADIADGLSPTEAIKRSDTAEFTEKVNAILKKLHDSRIDWGGRYMVELGNFTLSVSNNYIDSLPESVTFDELEISDSGWGGNGLYDLRVDIDCGKFTFCLDVRAYDPYSETSWKDVDFRIENAYFVDSEPAYSYDFGGGWTASVDRNAGQSYVQMILKNTDGRQIATFERVDAQSIFGFHLSPGGKYVAIEHTRDVGEEKCFFIQSLCGNVFEGYDYMYYVNKYFGEFTGGLEWTDAETLTGKNEFGSFTWNMSEMTPVQDIDEIPDGTKELVRESQLGNYTVTMTIPASWLDRGYFSDMAREKDKKDSTTRMLPNNGMVTAGLIGDKKWNPKALNGTGWTSQNSVFTYGTTTEGKDFMQVTTYYPDSYDKYTTYLLAFRDGDKVAFTMEFTSYGDDEEGYYTKVILPVIKSVKIEKNEN